MITEPGKTIGDLAMKLTASVAPETSSAYAAANAGMIAVLLQAIAQDCERAVANRVADIAEMKAVFAAAGDAPNDAERASYSRREPATLHLSDVTALHAEGLRLLIDLHAWAEAHDAALNQSIWTFLFNHTERNKLEW